VREPECELVGGVVLQHIEDETPHGPATWSADPRRPHGARASVVQSCATPDEIARAQALLLMAYEAARIRVQ
jgi:hypothetical protein